MRIKESLYFTSKDHTGHLTEASSELLVITLDIAREKEQLLEGIAHISPDLASVGILAIPLPSRLQIKWAHKEGWVGRFLCSARIIKDPEHLDRKLEELLPFLDSEDPDNTENFLFGSRERTKYLLSDEGINRLGSLQYGVFAYVESRILRMGLSKGLLLTQVPTA